jgi:hypothetical protein
MTRKFTALALVLGLGLTLGACAENENVPAGETEPGAAPTDIQPESTPAQPGVMGTPGEMPATEGSPATGTEGMQSPGTVPDSAAPGGAESMETPGATEATPAPATSP